MNDTVEFKVEITAFGELETINSDDVRTIHKNSLEAALRTMINDPLTADMVFLVEVNPSHVEKIFAHKAILSARSDVFHVMFSSCMKESTTGEVHIKDFDPIVIKAMVQYMYTDDIPEKLLLTEHGVALLCLAIKYQVMGLVEVCETFLSVSINLENIISTLQFSNAIGAETLKSKALLFIAQNSLKIMQMKEFSELEGELLQDVNNAIDLHQKRKGCRGIIETGSSKGSSGGCSIM